MHDFIRIKTISYKKELAKFNICLNTISKIFLYLQSKLKEPPKAMQK